MDGSEWVNSCCSARLGPELGPGEKILSAMSDEVSVFAIWYPSHENVMKRQLRRLCPQAVLKAARYVRHARKLFMDRRRIFQHIFETNEWADVDSVSGKGSNLQQTEPLRKQLLPLFRELGIRSILDAPCGDFLWMSKIDLTGIAYTGVDIVPEIIDQNRKQHAAPERRFMVMDIVDDVLPSAGLIICRDCLVHLSLLEAKKALDNLLATDARVLLATHFPDVGKNTEIITGMWRPLNLTREPFDLPVPEKQLIDPGILGDIPNKTLSLWSTAKIERRA